MVYVLFLFDATNVCSRAREKQSNKCELEFLKREMTKSKGEMRDSESIFSTTITVLRKSFYASNWQQFSVYSPQLAACNLRTED